MSGLRILLVGRSGCGKTTLTKELLAQRPGVKTHGKGIVMPCLIYDINQEYLVEYPEPFEDFDVFLAKLSMDETRHHYIIIEEATIFFNTQSNFQDMKNVLVRARHTGNIIQVNFHSFSSIPKGIYNLLDYVIVFKTNDNLDSVKGRFDNPKVLEAYKEAIKSPDPHFHRVIKIY